MTKETIHTFKGVDFDLWLVNVSLLCTLHKCAQALQAPTPPVNVAEAAQKSWLKAAETAKALIFLVLDKEHKCKVIQCTTLFNIIATLKREYLLTADQNKYFLVKEFFSLAMAEGGSMSSHIASLNSLIYWLEAVGEKVTPTYKKIALLKSLPSSWELIAKTSEITPAELTFEKICEVLMNEEQSCQDVNTSTHNTYTSLQSHHNNHTDKHKHNNHTTSNNHKDSCGFCRHGNDPKKCWTLNPKLKPDRNSTPEKGKCPDHNKGKKVS